MLTQEQIQKAREFMIANPWSKSSVIANHVQTDMFSLRKWMTQSKVATKKGRDNALTYAFVEREPVKQVEIVTYTPNQHFVTRPGALDFQKIKSRGF